MEDCRTAPATSPIVKPYWRNAPSETSIDTSSPRTPKRSTSGTVENCAISRRVFSAKRFNVRSETDSSPETATRITSSRFLNSRICGRSAAAGNVLIASTLRLISSRNLPSSRSALPSTMILPPLSFAKDCIRCIPCTVLRASSRRTTICSSISAGDAPSQVTSTTAPGNST